MLAESRLPSNPSLVRARACRHCTVLVSAIVAPLATVLLVHSSPVFAAAFPLLVSGQPNWAGIPPFLTCSINNLTLAAGACQLQAVDWLCPVARFSIPSTAIQPSVNNLG